LTLFDSQKRENHTSRSTLKFKDEKSARGEGGAFYCTTTIEALGRFPPSSF
jgi:hypothetical protein